MFPNYFEKGSVSIVFFKIAHGQVFRKVSGFAKGCKMADITSFHK